MSAVLLALVVLPGLLVLLLAVPIELGFRVQGTEALRGRFAVRWLFGLVRFSVPLADGHPARPPDAAAMRQAGRSRPHADSGRGAGRVLALMRRADFRRRLLRLVRDLLRATHLHDLGLDLRLGLGDPADTGRLWALVGPLSAAAQGLPNARVRVEPAFVEAVFEFDLRGRLRLVPLRCLALVLAFVLAPPSLRAWRSLRHA